MVLPEDTIKDFRIPNPEVVSPQDDGNFLKEVIQDVTLSGNSKDKYRAIFRQRLTTCHGDGYELTDFQVVYDADSPVGFFGVMELKKPQKPQRFLPRTDGRLVCEKSVVCDHIRRLIMNNQQSNSPEYQQYQELCFKLASL